ncbi:hypothetical protein DD594_26655, partial [Enterobacter cloacae complex sp. 4DZ1-17B1]
TEHLNKLFKKCGMYRIYLNQKRFIFMARQARILGHIVSKNGISTHMEKIKLIVEIPRPKNTKQVQCFMGHNGYYKRFIHMSTIISQPLYRLIIVFEWTEECEDSFQKLKKALHPLHY